MPDEDTKKHERGMKDEMIAVLREKNADLRRENRSLQTALAMAENDRLRQHARAERSEDDREALYDAVRILSAQVSNSTSSGRKARVESRKLLERHKIPPPHSLGSSRKAVSKKKRRKRST